MTIFITGVGGYIGSIATYEFLKKGIRIIGIDNFSTGFRSPLEFFEKKFGSQFFLYERDLRDGCADIFSHHPDIDAVIHFAGPGNIDESVARPFFYFDVIVGGTCGLLRSMEQSGMRNIIFSSSCAVYGNARSVPIDEEHPCEPISPYGTAKRIVEEILLQSERSQTFRPIILRYFNVCGASDDGQIGDSRRPQSALIQSAVRGALGIEPFFLTCQKVFTPDATPIRDYVNVVDLVDAHLKSVEWLCYDKDARGIFNLGTGGGSSVLEIVRGVEKHTNTEIQRKCGKERHGECAVMVASNERAKKHLCWEPRRSLSESISSLVGWYERHPNGWEY